MKELRKIDLSEAEAKMNKVEAMKQVLDAEQKELTELLVKLNLEYYGTSPIEFYKAICKKYCTEDGFSVEIASGRITILKKIADNLTVIYKDSFREATRFDVFRCTFVYDSGRHIQWSHQKREFEEKYPEQFNRFEEILQEEQVYNPFIAFNEYISFTDFF